MSQPTPQAAPPTPNVVGGYSYPADFPYTSVQEVCRILTGSTEATEKAAFGKHVWVVQGYAQSRLLGDPDVTSTNKPDFNVLHNNPQSDVVLGILNSLLKTHAPGTPTPHVLGSEGTVVKLSSTTALSTLLQWSVTKLLELLEQEMVAAAIA